MMPGSVLAQGLSKNYPHLAKALLTCCNKVLHPQQAPAGEDVVITLSYVYKRVLAC